MKVKRTPPLNLSQPEPPVAQPDHDLEVPGLNPTNENAAPPAPLAQGTALAASTDAPEPTALTPQVDQVAAVAPRREVGRLVYLIAGLTSVLWAVLAVFAFGYQRPAAGVQFQPMHAAVLIVLGVAPIGFIWLFAYALDQGARLAREVRQVRTVQTLPAVVTQTAEPVDLAAGVHTDIQSVLEAVAGARSEFASLREMLSEETARLVAATAESARTARGLGETLGKEREHLGLLARSLDGQAVAITDAVTRQARMVAEASDLAQAQIGESEAALAARAADLAAAAGEASDAARIASEDLSRQALRLETATGGVADQTRALEETLTEQRAALVATAHELRGDSEDFAVKLETQRAQVADMLGRARHSVTDINEAAASGSEALRELADVAAERARELQETTASRIQEITQATSERLRELADTAHGERDLLSAGALQSVGAITEAARYEREAMEIDARRALEAVGQAAEDARQLAGDSVQAINDVVRAERQEFEEQARRALEGLGQAATDAQRIAGQHADAARQQVEALSEAAFSAGQKAEAAYQQRLEEAQALITRSADLVDQAAGQSAARLESAAANARAVLGALESAVLDVEARVTRLPQEASAQAAAMKDQLAHSFDDLLASARRAAEETQAIDAAFQDRVKRNYEMLSEAVRLMGLMASPGARAASRIAPAAAPTVGAPATRSSPPDSAPVAAKVASADTPAPRRSPEPSARTDQTGEPALRPRLKFAPTRADEEVSQVFGAGQDKPAASNDEGGWTWQELLTSMDDGAVDDSQLADRLIGEIEQLGVDLNAILPNSRVQEIAGVLAGGDAPGARLVLRHLAPAAVGRLSRRAISEPSLRAHAERFVNGYAAQVKERAGRDGAGVALAELLATEPGRAFLLIDAALGDLS